jgi:hypothetical protein
MIAGTADWLGIHTLREATYVTLVIVAYIGYLIPYLLKTGLRWSASKGERQRSSHYTSSAADAHDQTPIQVPPFVYTEHWTINLFMFRRVLAMLGLFCLFEGADYPQDFLSFLPHKTVSDLEVGWGETRRIVPSEGLPSALKPQAANNNLDVVRHNDGRVYLAFRSAPTHYASPKAVLHVVSSTDEQTWKFEQTITLESDVREPRFLSFRGRLFLYMAKLGKDPFDFEPQAMLRTERRSDGTWTSPKVVDDTGLIPWRFWTDGDQAYLSAYRGGAGVYDFSQTPIDIILLSSRTGVDWTPAVPGQPVIFRGGGSEAAFQRMDDGHAIAVIRNEAGDDDGWGSKVCRSIGGHLGKWDCQTDQRKYDSPLLFTHDGEVFLIARRNVTETGRYQIMEAGFPLSMGQVVQTWLFQAAYTQARKRCALWHVDTQSLRISFVDDLPSQGDTCFPAILPGETPDTFVVYNYSSDLNGSDLPWYAGQQGETFIYRHVLNLRNSLSHPVASRYDPDPPTSFVADPAWSP